MVDAERVQLGLINNSHYVSINKANHDKNSTAATEDETQQWAAVI